MPTIKQTLTPIKLRAKVAAELYGVGLSTIWRYVRKGLITRTKVSHGVTVFDKAELDAFFSGRGTPPAAQASAQA